MNRILLLALIVFIVYLFIKRAKKPAPRATPAAPEHPMVSCAHCGLHVPQAESVAVEGRHFCCEEHRRAAAR